MNTKVVISFYCKKNQVAENVHQFAIEKALFTKYIAECSNSSLYSRGAHADVACNLNTFPFAHKNYVTFHN